MQAKPFIKWVGGKTQILTEIRKKYPQNSLKKYCEPFLGGGAVFFDMVSKYQFEEVLLNDLNQDLITAYSVVKNNVNILIEKLKEIDSSFIALTTESRKEFYYEKREIFNKINRANQLELATLFIFLNKTCFNGLYRVNSKGEFNVPMGDYKNPKICDAENLLAVSSLLQNVKLTSTSYENCLDFLDANTFIYLDPPYRPISKTASFSSYTKYGFEDSDQLKLGKFVNQANQKGAKIVLSNSDPKNIIDTDNFFDNLYKDFILERIEAMRSINSNSNGRGKISEILVSNFV